jgi:hypothetical protein
MEGYECVLIALWVKNFFEPNLMHRNLIIILILLFLNSCENSKGKQEQSKECEKQQANSKLTLIGNRFFTFNTVVRVNQIETSRNKAHGEDESSVHSPAEAKVFRETIEKGWPGAKMTWSFSWLALNDQRSNYVE